MNMKRLMVADQHRITAALLGVPESIVQRVADRLKADDRIPATRPQAAPITPLSLARLVLGLCAPSPLKASVFERQLGALPRVVGDGRDTVELELELVIAKATGLVANDIDFSDGELAVGIDAPAVVLSVVTHDDLQSTRVYRGHAGNAGMTRWVRVPFPTLRRLALELVDV